VPQSPSYRRDLESQRLLLEQELIRLYGSGDAGPEWVLGTSEQIGTQRGKIGYRVQDRTALGRAEAIWDRLPIIATLGNPDQLRDAQGRWTSGGALPKAVAYLEDHAAEDYRGSKGECAAFVRKALAADGIVIAAKDHEAAAYSYEKALRMGKYGFDVVADVGRGLGFPPPASQDFTPEAGDVVVIQAIPGHPNGHIAMYSGTRWISDFKQEHFWPHHAYDMAKPHYVIFRHK